ncbi:unnamed protein product [Prunus brigantina]
MLYGPIQVRTETLRPKQLANSFSALTKSILSMVLCLLGDGLQIYPMGLNFGYVIKDTHWNNFHEGVGLIQSV